MLGDRIKFFKDKKQLSTKQLSELTGLTAAYLSMIENNKRTNPSKETIEKLANALEVPIEELFKEGQNINEPEEINSLEEEKSFKTIAAHFDGIEFTEEEEEEINNYIEFLLSKRKNRI
ncbi:helix-turn-helix domain-containing protein [Tissierella sp. MSJ-40]|uniref:Helix-turn-helix domain-containing protein n=1 Tax=Tissierella simiarum TaxID=2841534 RepID=A0ABS6E0N1_9FIRM|nr:helix-turn-helix transcriptional regulator [Tissierella simiarum]MBU5436391.1 helix-turn-helix domain-containing protein [Tissierella simiarum]